MIKFYPVELVTSRDANYHLNFALNPTVSYAAVLLVFLLPPPKSTPPSSPPPLPLQWRFILHLPLSSHVIRSMNPENSARPSSE